jgi:TonB family protein
MILLAGAVSSVSAQSSNPNFAGAGGKGLAVAVLEPAGKGLAADEQWMLSLVQGSIAGDFKAFSAMTIVERQHVEKIMADVAKAMESGYYSDETMVKIGQMTNAKYVLAGVITKTKNTYMLELAVTDAQSGERKASYSPRSISLEGLENLSAVKAASADLLKQLGVELTAGGLEELLRPLPVHRIQGQAALAQGIAAQRQGTEVTALSYFYQAAALDPTLLEATNRSKVISANITSGNIGADVRNEIAWRKAWVAKLTEFEEFFSKMINAAADPPYSFFYSTDIQRGKINFQTETIDLSIKTNLRANKAWMNSIEQSANSVYGELNAGLNATKKRSDWGLGNWPGQGVTNTSPFATSPFVSSKKWYDITIAFELLNDKRRVIGKQELKLTPSFSLSGYGDRIVNTYKANTFNTVAFDAVNANEISDNLAIRIASVNGGAPERARFQITALTKEQELADFGGVTGGRSRESIQRVVMQNMAALRYAYNRRLRDKPGLNGEIKVKFAIDESGKVISAQVVESVIADAEFEKTVVDRIKSWNFGKIDKPGDVTEVIHLFEFSQ